MTYPPIVTASGFEVGVTVGSANEESVVSWTPVGHASLSQAGWAALLSTIATYIAGRGMIRPSMSLTLTGYSGSLSVLPGDLATQQAAIASALNTGGNTQGSAH